MDSTILALISRGTASSTLAAYESGKRRYIGFCTEHNLTPLPLDERKLLSFVAFLFRSQLSYQTVRSYLSAVRHMQIISGLPDPALSSFCRLNYALLGVKRLNPIRQRPEA